MLFNTHSIADYCAGSGDGDATGILVYVHMYVTYSEIKIILISI